MRPQHLNTFYENLSEEGIRSARDTAVAKKDILDIMKKKGIKKTALAKSSQLGTSTILLACRGEAISPKSAEAIATALGYKVATLFIITRKGRKLATKTVLEHHRLLHTILAQAEKEMLVPYNAAAKATPPKATQKEVSYFQLEDIVKIRQALEGEPLKWKVATNLLLITGCRRGEVMGLRWSKVSFEQSQIRIDTNLQYTPERGIYTDTTKTSTTRFLKLPAETMALLKQYHRWWLELKLKNGDRWVDTDFLFVRDNGEPMSPDSLTQWLAGFSKRHGLPHINPHAFRHTMASVLIGNGSNIVAVSKRLGHAKVSTTTDIYTHILAEADEQASESLADMMLRSG